MPLIGLSLIIQLIAAAHAVKTGRTQWIIVILLVPTLGAAIYFFMEVLPELRGSRGARQAGSRVMNTLDPSRNLREGQKNLEIADTVENRVALADELRAKGQHAEAETLYRDALEGVFADHPKLLLGLAQACFAQEKYADAKQALDTLIAENPEFKSQDGHLLYARALAKLGDTDAALHEYETLAGYSSGAEPRVRYGLLLVELGREAQARPLFEQVLRDARHAPKHYLKANREWLDLARKQLDD